MEFGRARFPVIRDSSPRIRGRAIDSIDRPFNSRDASLRSTRDARRIVERSRTRCVLHRGRTFATQRVYSVSYPPLSRPMHHVMTPNDRECVNPERGILRLAARAPIEKLLVDEINAGCCKRSKSGKQISRAVPRDRRGSYRSIHQFSDIFGKREHSCLKRILPARHLILKFLEKDLRSVVINGCNKVPTPS